MIPEYNERANFIEETGMIFERLGVTRMAGRILGYLMVSDKEHVSFDELTQVLQASKSSISTNLKALVNVEFVKPHTLPGDRKTYYMLSPDIDWRGYIIRRFENIRTMNDHFKKGLSLRVNPKDQVSKWLSGTVEFYDWLLKEYPGFMDQWQEEKKM
ncbi:MAG: hypothetical protein EA394_00785 [Bacteroidia bacterium]|nr:MAG: hypothetical protein EA394_00785 [Bacteroidia bacterium]